MRRVLSILLVASFLLVPFAPPAAAQGASGHVCFAPGTPEDTMAAWRAALFPANGLGFQINNRWTATALSGGGLTNGTPTTVTYSFVPDGTSIPSAGPGDPSGASNLFATLNADFGSTAAWQNLVHQVFARWSQLTGVTFVHEPNDDGAVHGSVAGVAGIRGDIRIGGRNIDGPSNTLAFAFFPNDGDIVIDTSEPNWNGSGGAIVFRNTCAHEIGHAIGLDHSCPDNNTKLMEPVIATAFDGPQQDDVLGAHRSYGDPFENDDALGTPKVLGLLSGTSFVGASLTGTGFGATAVPLSSDRAGDADFLQFTIAANATITATLTPVGTNYLSGPELTGGCSNGVSFNAAAAANLVLTVRDSTIFGVLGTANAAPAGGTETLSGISLTAPGPYYVVVSQLGTDAVQLYRLQITLSQVVPPLGGCAAGTVGVASGNGGPFDTFSINFQTGGSNRQVTLAPGNTIIFAMAAPAFASGPCSFAVFGWFGVPAAADAFALPAGLGTFCFPPCILAPSNPLAFTLANNLGPDPCLTILASTPTPWFASVPGGLPVPATFTFQGVLLTPHAAGLEIGITNAITLVIQ